MILTTVQALNNGWFDGIERPIFHFLNSAPAWFGSIAVVITQGGAFLSLPLWVALAWYLVNKRAAGVLVASSALAYFAAKYIKVWVHRGRPADLLDTVNIVSTNHFSGFGFPSGHSTFVAACVASLYFQVVPKYRRWLLGAAVAVGISRIVLGAHFPLDVVGGWALGTAVASLVSLLAGNSRSFISTHDIKKALSRRGFEVVSVRFMQLDARGSRPLTIKDAGGTEYFAKLFGGQEHAADWLFKLYRLFRYKNLQAEEPYINGRRNIELESFATLWARKNNVRVPDVLNLFQVGRHWLLVQERLDATSLDKMSKPSPEALRDTWQQVRKLHAIPVAHRDLRAANVMIDKKNQAWLIDFGFAECSPRPARMHMDNAELLMSMSLIAGIEQSVEAARQVIGVEQLAKLLPYLQKSVFSGATRRSLRKNSDILDKLRDYVKQQLGIEEEIAPANIDRLSPGKLINIGLLALLIYVILPQFDQFRGAFHLLNNLSVWWLAVLILATAATYIFAALIYVALAAVPLRLRDAVMVQLAASFVSKLMPSAVGGTALNTRYLIRSGLEAETASALVITQGVLGVALFVTPFLGVLLVSGQDIAQLLKPHLSARIISAIAAGLLIILAVITLSRRIGNRAKEFLIKLLANMRGLTASPREVGLAAAASVGVSAMYILCLIASANAFHVHLTVTSAIIIYAGAIFAKTVVPTPGGLGSQEIAMAAGLAGFGVNYEAAVAITVLYRLATFWLPIPLSVAAYHWLRRGRLV